jgi:hypothetical protein
MRSRSSLTSQLSSSTIRHNRVLQNSPAWPLAEAPLRLPTQSALSYIHDFDLDRATSPILTTVSSVSELACGRDEPFADAEEIPGDVVGGSIRIESANESESGTVPFPLLDAPLFEVTGTTTDVTVQNTSLESSEPQISPFRRWLSTLRKRHSEQPRPHGTMHWLDRATSIRSGHQKSSSFGSSIGFLMAVKSTSLTLAGTSIAPTSRHGKQSHIHSDNTSISFHGPRLSTESAAGSTEPAIDGKAWFRSIQRRNIVDEILTSEEGYISDMKAMIHVTFLL